MNELECDDSSRTSNATSTPTAASVNDENLEENDDFSAKEFKEFIEVFHVMEKTKREKYIRCKLCISMPNIVKIHSTNRKPPPMTTIAGCRYRKRYISEHFKTTYHDACKMAIDIPAATATKNTIDYHFDKFDDNLISHVTKLLFEIYVDAKKLTSSAYSWPARFVGSEAGRTFNHNDVNAPTIAPDLNLQYVNCPSYPELLTIIVESDKRQFQQKIENSIAVSIRVDGSVDRSQIDKIYIMLVLISADGSKDLNFIGISEQKTRGATGLFEAVKNGIIESVGEAMYEIIMKKISSICTDGTNMNSGEKGGLWTLFEKEMQRIGSALYLLKIWCSAHRIELVWGDVTHSHAVIDEILNRLSSISSYFHKSGVRTSELKKIATDNKLDVLSLPKKFTIRWTEFSYTMVNSFLRSWHALVIYFNTNKRNNAINVGYFKFLTKLENLRAAAFIADLLHIYSRYQKKIQSDKLTIIDLAKSIHSLENALIDLKAKLHPGGWEETLELQMEVKDEKVFLKGFELWNSSGRRAAVEHEFDNIRNGIIDVIIDRLRQRFERDNVLMESIEPFVQFRKDADLRKIHETFGADTDLATFHVQYNELCDQKISMKLSADLGKIIETLISNSMSDSYNEIITILSRIYVSTPQSADIERCISANNLIKTSKRNRLLIETENKYLYIYFNMPSLENWNPRPAIKTWMTAKQRRDNSNVIDRKATHAPYFKGIFENAQNENDDSANVKLVDKTRKF